MVESGGCYPFQVINIRTVRVRKDAAKGIITEHHYANESLGGVTHKRIHIVVDSISPLHYLLITFAVKVRMLENHRLAHSLLKSEDTLHSITIGEEDSSIVAIAAAIVGR